VEPEKIGWRIEQALLSLQRPGTS